MGIRESLNQKRGLAIGISVVAVVAAGALIYWQNRGPGVLDTKVEKYWTTDDGKTFFADARDQLPPVQIDGKTAYRAYLYSADGGKNKFVGYLERYDDNAKQRFADIQKKAQ